jgi:hypothetical protein
VLRQVALLLALLGHSERSGEAAKSRNLHFRSYVVPTQSIEISGLDYAFRVPEHVRAGRTTFTFANRGKVSHEFNLNLLARDAASPTRHVLDHSSRG